MNSLDTLQAGVTEIHVQPCIDTPEVRALGEISQSWIDDYELVVNDQELRDAITASGATMIGFRELRTLMRTS